MAKNFDEISFFTGEDRKEVQSFIDELFDQISTTSDFSLVDRSHEDQSWENAFSQGKATIIPNLAIINEYKSKFARQ